MGSLHFNRGHLIHQTLFLVLSLPLSFSFINRPDLTHPLCIGRVIWTRCLVTENSFWNYCLFAKLRWKTRLKRTQTNTQVTLKDELGVFPISTLLTGTFMTLFEINKHYVARVWLLPWTHEGLYFTRGRQKGALTVNQKVKPIIASLITPIKPFSSLTYHKKHFPNRKAPPWHAIKHYKTVIYVSARCGEWLISYWLDADG